MRLRCRWEVGCDAEDWIDLTQDRDQWQAYVLAIINLWVT